MHDIMYNSPMGDPPQYRGDPPSGFYPDTGSYDIKTVQDTTAEAMVNPAPTEIPQRKYLPTLADLVDRLTIVQLKAVFIPERRAEYVAEREDIEHDINLILHSLDRSIGAAEIHAIIVIMLANRFIWENESKARNGGSEQDRLLKLTHSINGVRNSAKNKLSELVGGRLDYKTDCFASELVKDFGNWQIFD